MINQNEKVYLSSFLVEHFFFFFKVYLTSMEKSIWFRFNKNLFPNKNVCVYN